MGGGDGLICKHRLFIAPMSENFLILAVYPSHKNAFQFSQTHCHIRAIYVKINYMKNDTLQAEARSVSGRARWLPLSFHLSFLSFMHVAQIAGPFYTLGGLTGTVCGLVVFGFEVFEV